MMDDSNKPARIRYTRNLSELDVRDLIQDEVLALIIENYCSPSLCDTLSQNILQSEQVKHYTHEVVDNGQLVQKYFGVDRLGFPFNLTYNASPDSETVLRYYEDAAIGIQRLRAFCHPSATPIDKLRLELDETNLTGASVAAFEGRKMLAGIGRITKSSLSHLSAEQPHFDALPTRYANLEKQFADNIYLKVPDKGGELEVWDVTPMHPFATPPANWRAELPPSIKIRPRQGDLVLFNCRRPHAICSFVGEDRVTVQMFIGYQSGKPLQLWN